MSPFILTIKICVEGNHAVSNANLRTYKHLATVLTNKSKHLRCINTISDYLIIV